MFEQKYANYTHINNLPLALLIAREYYPTNYYDLAVSNCSGGNNMSLKFEQVVQGSNLSLINFGCKMRLKWRVNIICDVMQINISGIA